MEISSAVLFTPSQITSAVERWDFPSAFHCVKSVQIRSSFLSLFSCIRTEYAKIRTTKKSIFGHFSRSDLH